MKQFYLPTRVVTGNGCFVELAQHAAQYGRRALLVCGARSLRTSGRLDQTLASLEAAGIEMTVYDAVSHEPTLDVVQEGLTRARARAVDLVIGIGGGSAVDTAKAIAGLFGHQGTVREYFGGERTIEGGGVPWIAVPTTAGTGAEVTKNAVLVSPEHDVKASLRHDAWFADVALVDPELTVTVPPGVTAASGSDALTQAIEAYTSIGASPATDALATDAIERIGRSLEEVCQNGQNLDARADMLYGSTLAGMAFASARLGGVHGMAHPLGYRYEIPHGVVCGLLLPHVMAYNVEYAADKYARVSRLLGVDTDGMDVLAAAQRAVERVREIVSMVGIETRLSAFGVKSEDFPRIAQESLPSGSLRHNPRPLAAQDIEAILSAAL